MGRHVEVGGEDRLPGKRLELRVGDMGEMGELSSAATHVYLF